MTKIDRLEFSFPRGDGGKYYVISAFFKVRRGELCFWGRARVLVSLCVRSKKDRPPGLTSCISIMC